MRSFSLRMAWTAIIVAVVLLPVMILLPWYGINSYKNEVENSLIEENLLNQNLAKVIEYETKHIINILQNKSDPIGLEIADKHDDGLIKKLTRLIVEREKTIHGLILVKNDGEVLAAYDNNHEESTFVPKRKGYRNSEYITHWGLEWDKETRSPEFVITFQGRQYISPVKRHENRYMFDIAVPVMHKNKVLASLVAEIDVSKLWAKREQSEKNKKNISYLVDRRGRLLTEVPAKEYRIGDLITSLEIVRAALGNRGWASEGVYKGITGQSVYGAVNEIKLLHWSVISEIDEKNIIEPIKKTILNTVLLVGIVVLISIYFGFHLLKKIVLPIDNIRKAMKEYSQNEASVQKIPQTSIAELNTVINGFNRMVIERAQMDNVLSSSKQRLALHREQAPLGVIEWTTGFEFVDWNPAAEKIFGYTKNEVIGKHITETILPESARPAVEKVWDELMNQTGGKHSINENITKDGKIILCEWHNTALIDESGSVIGVASFVEDITNRKMQEEQMVQSQKMDAMSKLTGGIAHDFNNLLNAILGYSDLINDRTDDDKLKKFATIIFNAGERGTKLTKKLLSFSAQESHEPEVADLNKLINDEENMLAKALTARISLKVKQDENLWPVFIDAADFQDAILNISINAMHAIDGSGGLDISTENAYLNDEQAKQLELEAGDYIALKFKDTGCGMDDKTLSKIFDPFFTTKGAGGSGLGMSQVYGFVKRSGGGLKVKSVISEGTEIFIYFPRYMQKIEKNKLSATEEKEQFKGNERILIVDDERSLRELNKELLSELGYQVLMATNGQEALELLENEKVDLVLSDVVMPLMDGYEMAEQIQKRWPEIKIQMVSGYSDGRQSRMKDDALHLNVLSKPFSAVDLLKKVREQLDAEAAGA